MLYPLKFKPILKQTIWGGDKLAYKSNDPKVKESIGESWEISGVQDRIRRGTRREFPARTD